MLMLDLFCGFKGASEGMRRRGWEIVTVDILQSFNPTHVADLRLWSYAGPRPDLIWASPPCQEFSRHSMPWTRPAPDPDMSLVNAAKRIIAECKPRWWVIENVRGAIPFIGKPAKRCGPYFLWGQFPDFSANVTKKKESLSGWKRSERAKVPLSLSLALADACDRSLPSCIPRG